MASDEHLKEWKDLKARYEALPPTGEELKQIIQNFDILFAEKLGTVSFSFREAKSEWLGALTLDERLDKIQDKIEELEQDVDEREKTFNQTSTFVGTVTYTPELQVMEIALSGRQYNYCRVPQRTYDGFRGAPSKGQYYNRNIKGQFNC